MAIRDLEQLVEDVNEIPPFNIEGMRPGEKIGISTENSTYVLERREDGFYIHREFNDLDSEEKKEKLNFLETPQKIKSIGSTWGGSAIRYNSIGVGDENTDRYLEFTVEGSKEAIRTSAIQSIDFPEN